jgi:hypothetical protein
MSSGADLFVVCRQCGSEVSPYITECPYCGHRLRRRAPKLPRERTPSRTPRLARRLRWRRSRRPSPALASPRRRLSRWHDSRIGAPPYATITLVVLSCGTWVAWRGGFVSYGKLIVAGPLHGDWWRLVTTQFAYGNTLLGLAIFGWLMERRWGPAVVLALFLGGGVAGALVASAVYPDAIVVGGNAGALALLAAWAVPDLKAARTGYYYEGDLLGAGAIAAVLLATPFARPEASWLAGVTGGVIGLLVGLGLHQAEGSEL